MVDPIDMKALIFGLRWGRISISGLSPETIEQILDYYVPNDVRQLCFEEIASRRQQKLKEKGRR